MKIDRAFAAGLADDVRDAAIVSHSIELAMGCDNGQGSLDSRPVPAGARPDRARSPEARVP